MEQIDYDYIQIEKKWQKKWFDEKIYESKKEKQKKFFIHFAYPGVSGYLHVGHMRGFTYCDIIARYKRMTGFDVLFPAGFHASGIPSFGFAKKVERKDKETLNMLRDYGCTEKLINKLTNPVEVVKYFGEVYINDYWKKFGFLIDYTRTMSTISEGYKKFIQWQFIKLKQKNLLVQKPHFAPFCPSCGPVAVDKSETDISKGGTSEILEFTIIKFKMKDGTIIPAATLRPETIYGVTNMWINPNVEYIKVRVNNETWICSKDCANKLKYQLDKIDILNESIMGKDLIGKNCKIPIINREIPILSGIFADPHVASGIVMSVPAHAPFDWIALVESKVEIDPINIIDVKGFGTNPAKKVCDEFGIKSQREKEKLELATEIVYKKEFHTGYLNENCNEYAGIKVSDIKDEVKNKLILKNSAIIMREFSEEVICRCGKKVVIKQIPDQWFIKYSDINLTENTKIHTYGMNIYPEDYAKEIPGILDWFDDRACIRKGSWLGTEFPYKKGWIIEPISDSTLYSAYYIISKYINEFKINPEEMNEEFFNFIFLNKGSSKNEIWNKIKNDFNYWYPVDINLGGKEHKTVHFPVFLMNHIAVMPENKRPKGIFVHWWITQKGKGKISKSKGGAEHIAKSANIYGVDAMRLYYTHVGSPFVDVEWDPEIIIKYKNRVTNIWKLVFQLSTISKKENENIDKWLISILNRRIKKIIDAFDNFDLRIASNEIFFECQKDIRWYLKRGGGNSKIIDYFINCWIRLMTPITPHIAEELWSFNNDNLISDQLLPKFNNFDISEETELGEYLISKLIDDTNEIIKVTKIKPKKIYVYISPSWKWKLFKISLDLSYKDNFNISTIMKEAMLDPEMKKIAKQVSHFAMKLPNEINKLNTRDEKKYLIKFDGFIYLENSKDYLKDVFSCEVEICRGDDNSIYDPENKSKNAVPLRPAIYLE